MNWFFDRGGESKEKAVIICAKNLQEEINLIFDFLTYKHGEFGKNWKIETVERIDGEGKIFEVWKIGILKKRKKVSKTYYFDVTLTNRKKENFIFKALG